MKNIFNEGFRLRMLSIPVLVLMMQSTASAQMDGSFLKGGIDDGMKLVEAYFAPWAKAFGAGFNGGWYNTAKPHVLGGFDITISVSAGFVPSAETSFDLNALGLSQLVLADPGNGSIAPTVAGSPGPGPRLKHTVQDGPYTIDMLDIEMPGGSGLKIIPVPMAQLGVGLPLGTDISLRFIPRIGIEEGSVGMWGLGLKHSIMQYIPGHKLIPVDVSLFGGYTRLNGGYPITVRPDSYADYENYSFEDFTKQEIAASVEGWNISAIASVDLSVVTFYGGLGYAGSRTNVNINGNIPMPEADITVSTTSPVYRDSGVVSNVRGVGIQDFSGLRANLGFRLKLSIFTFHADYTRSQYNVMTTGLGISFR